MTGKLREKNACKNAYLVSIFIPEKYVIRVLFASPWTSLIPPLAIRVPPPNPRAERQNCTGSSSTIIQASMLGMIVYWK